MRNRIILILMALLVVGAGFAGPRLVVWKKNGQKVFYDLAEDLHTSFSDGKLVISSSSVRTEYALSDLLRYTYDGAETGIEANVSGQMGFVQRGDNIVINGLEVETAVQLYDTSGRLLETRRSGSDRRVEISLHNYPTGVYIVKLGDQSLKFIKQ